MLDRSSIGAVVLLAVLSTANTSAPAQDLSKYPDWSYQWLRVGPIGRFDPTKPRGLGQQVPLTPEYLALQVAGIADMALGGQGTDHTYTCIPEGMPRVMNVVFPMEMVILPKTTYILVEYLMQQRRIYTDGRDWPKDAEPSFMGYSIGKWADTDGDGRYDELQVETRNFRGPRSFEAEGGAPLHADNKTIVKERFFIDKGDPELLHDEITVIDNALTRPWTVLKGYRRERNAVFLEQYCAVGNQHVKIGKDDFLLSADGLLMPTRKDQPPPDLRYFKQTQK